MSPVYWSPTLITRTWDGQNAGRRRAWTPTTCACAAAIFMTKGAKPGPWPLARCSTARLPPTPLSPAYALNAFSVQRAITHGWGEPRGKAALDLALDLAHRAVALEPGSSLCLSRLAFVLLLCQGRGNEAVGVGRSAVFANPSDAIARYSYGHALTHTGNPEAAVEELRLSLELNPFHSALRRAGVGRALLLAGRHDEAIAELRWCAAHAPDWATCHAVMVVAFVEMGLMDDARASLRKFQQLRPGWQPRNFDGPWSFHRESDAQRFLEAFRTATRGPGA